MGEFLDISGAERSFGTQRVLGGVDLAVAKGELVSLLGPSGCGKTTLLRIVAGLLAPDRGSVTLDGRDITRMPPHQRDVGVVFQSYALFPHLTVAENVAFGLAARRTARDAIESTVRRFLDLVHMAEFHDRSVRALSGGQQQRVAVARALAVQPKLLLLDEPFSALDRKLRETMQIELKRLLRELSTTAIFVTHDQDEALMMSDRIAVMNSGAIEQLAAPAEVYHRPATPFVLGFVGLSTRIAGTVVASADGRVELDTRHGRLKAKATMSAGMHGFIAIRPERLHLCDATQASLRTGASGETFDAELRDIVFQGSKVQLHFAGSGDDQIMVEAARLPDRALAPGSTLTLAYDASDALAFAAEAAS